MPRTRPRRAVTAVDLSGLLKCGHQLGRLRGCTLTSCASVTSLVRSRRREGCPRRSTGLDRRWLSRPVPRLVVHAGRFVDVVSGDVLEDHRIVVDGESVTAVLGPGEEAPPGESLDLGDCTVLPGLIDLHTHLVGPMEAGDLAAVIDRSPAEEALVGVANARATLEAGVTTVRDVGTFWAFVDVDLQERHRRRRRRRAADALRRRLHHLLRRRGRGHRRARRGRRTAGDAGGCRRLRR